MNMLKINTYFDALRSYLNASAVLHHHTAEWTHPTAKELQDEKDARVILEAARATYLAPALG